jgi:O-methyltransferase
MIALAGKSAVVNWKLRFPRRLQTLYLVSMLGEFASRSGLRSCPHFPNRYQLYEHVHARLIGKNAIDYLEFGVFQGASLKKWTALNANPNSTFVGFDTFEGLPEAWGVLEKGYFSTEGKLPHIQEPRVTLIKGMFQQTLAPWLGEYRPNNRLVIHLDADLYTSTLYVLAILHPIIRPNTIILFDEFGHVNDEFRAFMDYTSSFQVRVSPIGLAGTFYEHAAFVVL